MFQGKRGGRLYGTQWDREARAQIVHTESSLLPPNEDGAPSNAVFASRMDGGRDFSAKAREEWNRKEEQAHEAVRAMLRRLDGTERDARPSTASAITSTPIRKTNGARDEKPSFAEEVERVGAPRRVVNRGGADGVLRNRRLGKFVEHLSSEEDVAEMERGQVEVSASAEEKADWRLSRTGPKIVSYERAPWEEDEAEPGPQEEEDQRDVEKPPSPISRVQAPVAPVYVQQNESRIFLEDITEDEEDEEVEEGDGSITSQSVPGSSHSGSKSKPKVCMPPADYVRPTQPSPPSSHFPIYKLPGDIFPAPPTPRSPNFPSMSPVSDLASPPISKTTPPKSPTSLRARAGLKKIFLSIRPRKRDDEPLSPTHTLSSSAATTPSLPTPTIRITSPFHPRRFDGSPIGDEHPTMGKLSPLSPVESVSYRLPELRLSRADWGEWGRQVAERL